MNEEETKVEVTEAVAEQKQEAKAPVTENAKMKKGILIGGIAVAAIVICILGISLFSSGRYQRIADSAKKYFELEEDVIVNIKGKTIECEEDIYGCSYSADGSLTVVKDVDSTLWVVKGKKLVQVDEDVDVFWISTYGDTIAYMKELESTEGELWLYNVNKKKAVELSSDAYPGYVTMSPDGKSVAFVELDKNYNATVMKSKNGKEAEEVENEAWPIAISDNASSVFYMTNDGKFYVNDEKIESKGSVSGVHFNEDMTEVLYNVDGEAKYYNVKKQKTVDVDNERFYRVLIPSDAVYETKDSRDTSVYYYGIDTFNKSVVRIGDGLFYLCDKGEKLEKITSSYGRYRLSENGKSLLFTDDDKLVYVKNVAKPDKAEKYKKLNVDSLYASKDLKTVYFINYDDELCYLKKGEGVVIAKDVYSAEYSDKYNVIYFLDEDELRYAKKTKKSIKDVTDDVSYLGSEGDYIIITQDEDACVMTGKKKFKPLED